MKLRKSTVATALYAMIAMYLFFMILDRVLSLIYGFNFQPYGVGVPLVFTIWGHFANGSLAIFGIWVLLKAWMNVGRREHALVTRIALLSLFLFIMLWIPYNNDASHLISHGSGDSIPTYMIANAVYVGGAGLLILRFANSWKLRLCLLGGLLISFLLIHFLFYVPRFSEFRWT